MPITCFSWTTCQHTEHQNDQGQRVGYEEVRNPENGPISQQLATYPCPACTDPYGDHNGIGIRPILQSAITNAAPVQTSTTGTSFLNPIVDEFVPSVQSAQTVPSMTGSQYDSTTLHNDNYAIFNPYANLSTSNNEPIPYTTPHGGFDPAAPQPDPFSNTNAHTRATGRQQCTYYEYPHNDVEGLIVSHNSLPINNRTNNYAATEELMPYGSFTPTEAITPYNSSLARHNACMAAASKQDGHKAGRACPDGSPYCHWHYARHCHQNPATCRTAAQAIAAAFHARGPWKDAPTGWNAAHEACIRAVDPQMCDFHKQIHRKVLGSSFD